MSSFRNLVHTTYAHVAREMVTVACITNHTSTSTYDQKMQIDTQTYGQEQRADVSTIAHACNLKDSIQLGLNRVIPTLPPSKPIHYAKLGMPVLQKGNKTYKK